MRVTLILPLIVFIKVGLLPHLEAAIESSLVTDENLQGWEITENIQRFCFNAATSVIILPNDWHENQSKFLSSISSDLIPSYLFGKNDYKIFEEFQRFRQIYQLKPIHLSRPTYPASSVTIFMHRNIDLPGLLAMLERSIWWNSRAKFLLISYDNSTCTMAQELLKTIWTYKVSSAIYLCSNGENRWILYTFNPYTYLAPKFWARVEWNNHVDNEWTLFQYPAGSVEGFSQKIYSPICETLYFDKFQNTNGHKFKALLPKHFTNNSVICGQDVVENEYRFVCDLFKAMNAMYNVKFTDFMGLINASGQPYDNINEVISGTIDFGLFRIYFRDYWWLQTYPYTRGSIKFVTPIQSRYVVNFSMMFKPFMWILLPLLILLTILSLQYILKSTFVLSALEFVKIFVSTGTLRMPTRSFERICFICTIFFWLIINIYIQSNFSADKIAIDKSNPINTVEDLINSKLPVHGIISFKELISNKELRQRFVKDEFWGKCIKSVSRKEHLACIVNEDDLNALSPEMAKLHVSKESLTERGISWLFSDSSPLLFKVNSIMSKFNEGGIINYYFEKKKLHSGTNKHAGSYEFDIAFRILIGGLSLGSVVAILEIIIALFKCT